MLMMQIKEPRPKIKDRIILLRRGTCRRQMIGMGRTRIRISVLCGMTLVSRKTSFLLGRNHE